MHGKLDHACRSKVSAPDNLRVQMVNIFLTHCPLHDEIFQAQCSRRRVLESLAGEHRTILPSCANLLINPLTALFSPRSSLDISLPVFLPRRQHFQSLAQVRRERSGFLCSLCFKLSHRAQPPPVRKVCSFKARKFSDLVEEREVKDENCAIAARFANRRKAASTSN